jgi:hypothetical protein
MGQQQLVTQPQMVGQQVCGQQVCGPQLIAQPQLVSPMSLIGLVQAVAVAPQACSRQVLRPVPIVKTGHGK